MKLFDYRMRLLIREHLSIKYDYLERLLFQLFHTAVAREHCNFQIVIATHDNQSLEVKEAYQQAGIEFIRNTVEYQLYPEDQVFQNLVDNTIFFRDRVQANLFQLLYPDVCISKVDLLEILYELDRAGFAGSCYG